MSKKTLNAIIEPGNDYVVQVKLNQKNLYKTLKEITNTSQPVDNHISDEKSRGRNEIRKTQLFLPTKNIPQGWPALNSIVKVARFTKRKGKETYEESFYISSICTVKTDNLAKGIRNHWSIENRLHWVKDVMQYEDNAAIKKGNGIEILTIFRNIAINISRGIGYDSIKDAQIYFASNVKELYNKIRI